MNIKFPLLEKRPRKRHRSIKAPAYAPPAPPPPAPVTVVAVTAVAGMPTAIDFLFSAPATCDGGECPAIVLDLFGIVDYPRTSEQLSPAAVRFFMLDDLVAPGVSWEIVAQPTPGLDLHGATMAVPQAGVVG
jgi:hypothetical protein